MHVDRPRLKAARVQSPDAVEQFVAIDGPLPMDGEIAEHRAVPLRQRPFRSVTERDAATIEIDEPTDNVSCRFTVETQRITVRVNDLADSGADHHFTSCRGSEGCGVFFIDDDAGADATVPDHIASGPIPAGTYTISLEPDPGRELVSIVCTAGTVDLPALRATVTIAPSQHPVCTFTTRPR